MPRRQRQTEYSAGRVFKRQKRYAKRPAKSRSTKYSKTISPKGVLSGSAIKLHIEDVELKTVDTLMTSDGTTTASITCLNLLAQGTTAVTRIGRSILMKSIQARLWIKREDVTTTTVQSIRCALFYDKQVNGAAPVVSDFWVSGTGNSPTWLRNLNNTDRFYCLYDKVYNLDGAGGSTVLSDDVYRAINLPVLYKDTTVGDITDVQTGALWMVYAGMTAAGADDIDVQIQARVRFTDA